MFWVLLYVEHGLITAWRIRPWNDAIDDAPGPSQTADVNSIVWERFTAEQQEMEIDATYGPAP